MYFYYVKMCKGENSVAKITKKLKYKKDSATKEVNLYSSADDVGTNYIRLIINKSPAYMQTAEIGTTGNSDLRVLNNENVKLAVNYKAEDEKMITDGGSVVNTGTVVPAPTPSGTYSASGQNKAATYVIKPTWTPPTDDKLIVKFLITIQKHITLSDVHHFRVKYGTDVNCTIDGGTFTENSTTVSASPGTYYFLVQAEDETNNVLYSSPAYGPITTIYSTVASALSSYYVENATNAGASRTRIYSGLGTSTTHADVSKRWFYVASAASHAPTGDSTESWSNLTCADSCTCNCNYCTCNCNYCPCNCNYCPCNCDYSPCSCSSSP